MKRSLPVFLVCSALLFLFLCLVPPDSPDPGYIKAFGNGSICVSQNGYPKFGSYDPSQFDFRDGKFYISKNTKFDLRAFLPEGKTYSDLINDFLKRKPHDPGNRENKIIWRVFASHDMEGKKIFTKWPPLPEDMEGIVTYMTSPKELCFSTVNVVDEVLPWITSGVTWGDDKTNLSMLCGNWLSNAQPGWQLYIVNTVGYITRHEGNDHYVVDKPWCSALVEIK